MDLGLSKRLASNPHYKSKAVQDSSVELNTQEVQPQEIDQPKVKRVRRARKTKSSSKGSLSTSSGDQEEQANPEV